MNDQTNATSTEATDTATDSDRAAVERGEIPARNENATATETVTDDASTEETFLPQDRLDDLKDTWADVQANFVDDPRKAVTDAQALVGTVVDELTQTFQRRRGALEGQWTSGESVDTEMLRVTLQRYRDFFNRLLATSE